MLDVSSVALPLTLVPVAGSVKLMLKVQETATGALVGPSAWRVIEVRFVAEGFATSSGQRSAP